MMPRFFRYPSRRGDGVEERLRARAAALAEAVEGGRRPDPVELEDLEALRRLVDLRATLESRRGNRVIAVAGALALVVGLMLLRRVGTVEVSGVVQASVVQLSIERGLVLALDRPLRELAARGFTHIEGLPAGTAGGGPASLVAERLSGGTLTLQQITLPDAARLNLERVGPGRTRLRVDQGRAGGGVRVEAQGPARFVAGRDTLLLEGGSGHGVLMEFGTETFNVSFSPADSAGDLLIGLAADSLSFSETQHTAEGVRGDVVQVSTIHRGELILPGLRGEKVTLNAGEHLYMETRSLRIHRVRPEPNGITVEFRAQASKLALGDGAARRDVRPSLLEWYAANRRIELARTAYISGLAMLLGLLAWWRRGR